MKLGHLIAKAAIHGLEGFVNMQDSIRLPLLKGRQERLIHATFKVANKVAVESGLPPKVYKRLKDRDTVEMI